MSSARTHFWQVVIRGASGLAKPANSALKGAIPAAISKSVGSFTGTIEKLETRRCFFSFSKKARKVSRTLLLVQSSLMTEFSSHLSGKKPSDDEIPEMLSEAEFNAVEKGKERLVGKVNPEEVRECPRIGQK